jgi:hypothetical protein
MYTSYKGYRILTEVRHNYGIFEIYAAPRSQHPNRFEATGYVTDDYAGGNLAVMAAERAKSLIDVEMETVCLDTIRKLPRY